MDGRKASDQAASVGMAELNRHVLGREGPFEEQRRACMAQREELGRRLSERCSERDEVAMDGALSETSAPWDNENRSLAVESV
jgi:hypothetical protein